MSKELVKELREQAQKELDGLDGRFYNLNDMNTFKAAMLIQKYMRAVEFHNELCEHHVKEEWKIDVSKL